jgi:hypothetical protein
MPNLLLDDNGFPVLLADVPNSGAATVDADTASGNPRHDTNSGKFQTGSQQGDPVENIPANISDVQAYLRQRDAVRDIAREMDELASGDIQDLLAGRLTRPLEEEEITQFLTQVRQQRLDDLVDMLDWQFRNLIENVKRGRRRVRLTAPRGWVRKVFNSMTDEEVLSVINRLEARGHSRESLQRTILGRIKKKDRADALGARLSEIPENDAALELALDEIFSEPTDDFEEDETPTIIINNVIDPNNFKE